MFSPVTVHRLRGESCVCRWWLSVSQFLFTRRGEVIGPSWAQWAAGELAGADAEQRDKLVARRLDLMALLERATRVLAVSESFAAVYRAAGLTTIGVNENGVAELPAVPPPRYRPAGAPIVIGFVGGMSAHKGYDLLRAIVRGASLPNLEFLIVDHAMESGATRRSRWGDSVSKPHRRDSFGPRRPISFLATPQPQSSF